MDLSPYGRVTRRLTLGIAAVLGGTSLSVAQELPQLPTPPVPASSNPVAAPVVAPPARVAAPGALSNEALEARVRQLEGMVNQLSGQVQQGGEATATGRHGPTAGYRARQSGHGGGWAWSWRDAQRAAVTIWRFRRPGQSLPPNPSLNKRFNSPATLTNSPGAFKFGPGFELRSNDNEFFLQFHNLTQVEYRGYQQGGQSQVHDSFAIPRQWFMFSGRISQPVGYFVSLSQGFDSVNALDVFMDFTASPKSNLRMGRMKTPFTYEFLVEPIQGLINPERSVFFNNFGQNRDVGAMAYGRLLNNTFDYAAGIWNGARNGYLSNQDSKAFSGFINWKPFGNQEGSLFENFNIGGSVYTLNSNQADSPPVLRTVVPISGNNILGIPFLTFNSNTKEVGWQTFWDLHTAWFYKQLAVIAEWQSGFQDYQLGSSSLARTKLPVQSFYVQMGYLLTGETRSSVGIVKPNNPFSLKDGGLGAWELTARISTWTSAARSSPAVSPTPIPRPTACTLPTSASTGT